MTEELKLITLHSQLIRFMIRIRQVWILLILLHYLTKRRTEK